MGTKSNPGKFDCHAKAKDDEPYFTLLARDFDAPILVREWANRREWQIATGGAPESDREKVTDARQLADAMERWRLEQVRPETAAGVGEAAAHGNGAAPAGTAFDPNAAGSARA